MKASKSHRSLGALTGSTKTVYIKASKSYRSLSAAVQAQTLPEPTYENLSLPGSEAEETKDLLPAAIPLTRSEQNKEVAKVTNLARSKEKSPPCTDTSNKKTPAFSLSTIESLLLDHCHMLRDENRSVYFFDGAKYVQANSLNLAELVKDISSQALLAKNNDANFYGKLLQDLKTDQRIPRINRKNALSATKYLVAFQNGIYDCQQDAFMDFSPEIPLFSQLQVRYQPHAYAPQFCHFLQTVSGNDADIEYLIWQMLAYMMLPANDGKCFFVMADAPDSGKSLLARIVESLFDPSEVNRLPLHALTGNFALSSISGKRINIAPECSDTTIKPEIMANLKLLTGEQAANIEKKGETSSYELLTCKFLFASNKPLRVSGRDNAFWNRLILIPFLHSIEKEYQDMDLYEKLESELNDIASIAIQYCRELIDNNFRFRTPVGAISRKGSWRNNPLDLLSAFLSEKCVLTRNPLDFVSVKRLHDSYSQWIEEKHPYAFPLHERDFSRKIRENFSHCHAPREKEKVNEKYVRVLYGIILKNVSNG